MKEIITPFGVVSKTTKMIVAIFWSIFFICLFEVYHSPIIPAPTKIVKALFVFLNSKEFYEDLTTSLILTIKAMGYSIGATMIIVYLSRLPLFESIADFISKCRYLTITGLVFVFTVVSSNISELKISLLLFGIIPFFVTSFLTVMRDIPPQEIQKGDVNRKNRWQTLLEVAIIGKFDKLFDVMRQNFAISWMMITTVEGYAMSEGGVGTLLIKSNKYLNLGPVFAILIIVLTLGLLFDYLLSALRVFLFPYVKTQK